MEEKEKQQVPCCRKYQWMKERNVSRERNRLMLRNKQGSTHEMEREEMKNL
jgi:hypothetical protein